MAKKNSFFSAALAVAMAVIYLGFMKEANQAGENCGKRVGNTFVLCERHRLDFLRNGLSIAEDILTESEVKSIEGIYDRYMQEGGPEKQGKDFCDMSKPFNTPKANYSVINAMLPRVYYPELQGNIYEEITASIARQLFPDVEMVLDYDQLLDKKPGAADAVFAWHQDMAYWPNPKMTPDTRTVTFSLALDSTTKQNGCIRYVPSSGVLKQLREHAPIGNSRDDAHAIAAKINDNEPVLFAEVRRGSVSMHDEYVVHGSGGNLSKGPRRTYVIAYRAKDTVNRERAAGFTHSHNDKINWDVFNDWGNK